MDEKFSHEELECVVKMGKQQMSWIWWILLRVLQNVLDWYRHSPLPIKHETLLDSLLRGPITCIPTSGKTCDNSKNCRPITLLNNSCRFSSAILVNRIKSKFPKLIHSDQKRFVAGPFLGGTIRQIFDIINEVKHQIKMTSYY